MVEFGYIGNYYSRILKVCQTKVHIFLKTSCVRAAAHVVRSAEASTQLNVID